MQRHLRERRAERLDGGRHLRRVKGAAHVERDRAQALGARLPARCAEVLGRAGEDDLAGRVVVGDRDVVGLGEHRGLRGLGAEDGEHRAAAARLARLGHELAAQDDEAQRVELVEDARDRERAELAE